MAPGSGYILTGRPCSRWQHFQKHLSPSHVSRVIGSRLRLKQEQKEKGRAA